MKLQIVGFEGSSGVGKTSGKAFEIGQLHAIAPLAAPYGDGGVSKGSMGTTYRCPLPLIMKIQGLQPPFMVEVDVRDVMKFGKREQEVHDITPFETVRKAA
jgi:hypothetical protein